jgi:ABC-2 type transport system permease protein
MTALARRLSLRGRRPSMTLPSGISAIIVKELRGRMRGRRAFVIVTLHILLLAVFAWMFQRLSEERVENMATYGGQATYASATVGRSVFFGLMMIQTLIVAVLAPAATAGAISSEREHQTLDLLAVTPISSLAIVLGKLLSALAWVFILILASIPVTALVFVFGGVAPDDVVRGYAVLFATVIGLGSVGIFFSALTRRTGASTGLTFVTTIALVIGTYFVFIFLGSTADVTSTGLRKQPPESILYLNPFIAQADVICGTEDGAFGGTCSIMSLVIPFQTNDLVPPDVSPVEPVPMPGIDLPGRGVPEPMDGGGVKFEPNVIPAGGIGDDGEEVANAQVAGFRDRFWPKSVLSFLALSAILTTLSVQFVTPTRRWRPSLPGPVRRLIARRSAP